jgi:hypothetical protein
VPSWRTNLPRGVAALRPSPQCVTGCGGLPKNDLIAAVENCGLGCLEQEYQFARLIAKFLRLIIVRFRVCPGDESGLYRDDWIHRKGVRFVGCHFAGIQGNNSVERLRVAGCDFLNGAEHCGDGYCRAAG